MANKPSAEELKKNLSEMQFYVTQNHGTEPPFTGRLLHNKRDGVYHCLRSAMPRCFIPKPSMIPAVVGPVSTNR